MSQSRQRVNQLREKLTPFVTVTHSHCWLYHCAHYYLELQACSSRLRGERDRFWMFTRSRGFTSPSTGLPLLSFLLLSFASLPRNKKFALGGFLIILLLLVLCWNQKLPDPFHEFKVQLLSLSFLSSFFSLSYPSDLPLSIWNHPLLQVLPRIDGSFLLEARPTVLSKPVQKISSPPPTCPPSLSSSSFHSSSLMISSLRVERPSPPHEEELDEWIALFSPPPPSALLEGTRLKKAPLLFKLLSSVSFLPHLPSLLLSHTEKSEEWVETGKATLDVELVNVRYRKSVNPSPFSLFDHLFFVFPPVALRLLLIRK